jgi:hypothetical protein
VSKLQSFDRSCILKQALRFVFRIIILCILQALLIITIKQNILINLQLIQVVKRDGLCSGLNLLS